MRGPIKHRITRKINRAFYVFLDLIKVELIRPNYAALPKAISPLRF
jgi:hypothetical protein